MACQDRRKKEGRIKNLDRQKYRDDISCIDRLELEVEVIGVLEHRLGR